MHLMLQLLTLNRSVADNIDICSVDVDIASFALFFTRCSLRPLANKTIYLLFPTDYFHAKLTTVSLAI